MIWVKMDSNQHAPLINSNKTNLDYTTSLATYGNGQPMHGMKMILLRMMLNVLRKEVPICVMSHIVIDTDVLPDHKTLLIARLEILVFAVLKIFDDLLADISNKIYNCD